MKACIMYRLSLFDLHCHCTKRSINYVTSPMHIILLLYGVEIYLSIRMLEILIDYGCENAHTT